jgi:choline dehydrogenase-like flavoprotein
MGTDEEATVDLDLRVRGTQNLYVLSTGVFPSAGTANPTFSMLCLGDMLADKLVNYNAD